MEAGQLIEALSALEAESSELDIRIWLLAGETLGTSQSDGRGRLLRADRNSIHFKPSATWNGRDLAAAFAWCLAHNRDEIIRIAHDWGVPRFTASVDAARMLISPDHYIKQLNESDGKGKNAVLLADKNQDQASSEDQPFIAKLFPVGLADTLPAAICIAALYQWEEA